MWVGSLLCGSVWRSQVNVWYLSSITLHYIFLIRVSHWTRGSQFGLASEPPRSAFLNFSSGKDRSILLPKLFRGFWGLNSGIHACLWATYPRNHLNPPITLLWWLTLELSTNPGTPQKPNMCKLPIIVAECLKQKEEWLTLAWSCFSLAIALNLWWYAQYTTVTTCDRRDLLNSWWLRSQRDIGRAGLNTPFKGTAPWGTDFFRYALPLVQPSSPRP